MVLTDRDGERTLSFCGTILSREKLESCDGCGAAVGPARYVEYVRKRIRPVGDAFGGRLLCAECVRRTTAESKSGGVPPERI
jgi:hypothetical protein